MDNTELEKDLQKKLQVFQEQKRVYYTNLGRMDKLNEQLKEIVKHLSSISDAMNHFCNEYENLRWKQMKDILEKNTEEVINERKREVKNEIRRPSLRFRKC